MAKYINTAMAIEALEKGLDVWIYDAGNYWATANITQLVNPIYKDKPFAIGEKPTSPPRKMIEIDGVRMPAPIMRVEDLPVPFWILCGDGKIYDYVSVKSWMLEIEQGYAFATEADAIAVRDARKLILERAMERAK